MQSADINLQSQIDTKQDIINVDNRLNTAFLGSGEVSNAKLETLSDIITTETVQHQINSIKTNVQNLTGLQDIDIVDITQMQLDIADATTFIANLQGTDTAQSTINTSVANTLTSHGTSITSVQANVSSLSSTVTNYNTSNDSSISSIQSSIGTLQSDLSDLSDVVTNYNSNNDTVISSFNHPLHRMDHIYQVKIQVFHQLMVVYQVIQLHLQHYKIMTRQIHQI